MRKWKSIEQNKLVLLSNKIRFIRPRLRWKVLTFVYHYVLYRYYFHSEYSINNKLFWILLYFQIFKTQYANIDKDSDAKSLEMTLELNWLFEGE